MSKKRTRQIIVGNTPLNVDFGELHKQLCRLAKMAYDYSEPEANPQDKKDAAILEGVLSLLEAFVDASAEVLGEEVVFGKATK